MDSARRNAVGRNAAVILAAVWLGMVIGVSFVATPVKFTAPLLELGPALDVGRVTFRLFSRLEWLLAILLMLSVFLSSPPRLRYAAVTFLLIILVVQSGWLLPALDDRVQAILDARPLAPSWDHTAYALLEAVKVLALVAIIWSGVRCGPGPD